MNIYDASEQAYKNGYEKGIRDLQNALINSDNTDVETLVDMLLAKLQNKNIVTEK